MTINLSTIPLPPPALITALYEAQEETAELLYSAEGYRIAGDCDPDAREEEIVIARRDGLLDALAEDQRLEGEEHPDPPSEAWAAEYAETVLLAAIEDLTEGGYGQAEEDDPEAEEDDVQGLPVPGGARSDREGDLQGAFRRARADLPGFLDFMDRRNARE